MAKQTTRQRQAKAQPKVPPTPAPPQPQPPLQRMFLLPEGLAQAVLNYLAARPYMEVFELVEGLRVVEPFAPKEIPSQPAAEGVEETESAAEGDAA